MTILIMFEDMFMVPWLVIVPLVHQNPFNPLVSTHHVPYENGISHMANPLGDCSIFRLQNNLEQSPKTISQNVEHFPRNHGKISMG